LECALASRWTFSASASQKFEGERREQIVAAYPRGGHFKERIIQTFSDSIKHAQTRDYF
jgi:hypothetical protein